MHVKLLSSAKSVNATLADALLLIANIFSSVLNHNKRLTFMKNTHIAEHHCRSHISVSMLDCNVRTYMTVTKINLQKLKLHQVTINEP
jgi:hypothetical protein